MSIELWRNIAVVWLALLCFIALVVPLGIALFAVKGMHIALTRTSGWLEQGQRISATVRDKTVNVADRVAAPVVSVESKATGTANFVQRLLPTRRRRQRKQGRNV